MFLSKEEKKTKKKGAVKILQKVVQIVGARVRVAVEVILLPKKVAVVAGMGVKEIVKVVAIVRATEGVNLVVKKRVVVILVILIQKAKI